MPRPTARASAREKLSRPHDSHGKVCDLPPAQRKGAYKDCKRLLIPLPADVEALMRKVPKGKVVTMGSLRAALAQNARADMACPLCTGIFVRLIGDAAEEDRSMGKTRITPWWRTIRDDGKLNDKFPGGAQAQATLLRAEGHTILKPARGNALRVSELERHAWNPAP
ncbi:MAG: MGMT family protein [Phycisphaerales bacterium]